MGTKQQNEALGYFKQYAQDWKRKAENINIDNINIIKQRNDYVIDIIAKRTESSLTLDIGCGTGDLVCEIAKKGINSIGVDFAQEMIDIANDNARKMQLNNASFVCASAFDYEMRENEFDVISANGFIEYISYAELDKFFTIAHMALKKGGSLVVGSRNRLFNLFSMNKFTKDELEGGKLELLLNEAITIVSTENIKNLENIKIAPLQEADHKHDITGVKVNTRYQFTPAQLIQMLKEKGFECSQIFPVHIHGVSPKFANKLPSIHGNIANLLQNYAGDNMSLIPQSSSFMIHVKKI